MIGTGADGALPVMGQVREEAAIGDLTAKLEAFKASSDQLARRVVALNGILVCRTLVLTGLTIVLIVKS